MMCLNKLRISRSSGSEATWARLGAVLRPVGGMLEVMRRCVGTLGRDRMFLCCLVKVLCNVLRPTHPRRALAYNAPPWFCSLALIPASKRLRDSQTPPQNSQDAPRRPKRLPRRCRDCPRGPRDGPWDGGPNMAQEGSKTAQEAPKTAQESSKRTSNRPSRGNHPAFSSVMF